MPTALTSATTIATRTPHRLVITNPADVQHAADALADGGVVGHGFANVYAITTRPDADIVQRVNRTHDRPTDGLGSITVPPERIPDLFDWTQLPPGLTRRSVLRAVDAFYRSGPFGFRGPAAEHLPPHLTYLEADVMTTLVIAPGYDCPSNDFLGRALAAADTDVLHIASANPSDHSPGITLLEHPDDVAARSRYPGYQATSATILGFHRPVRVAGDRRPQLLLERHGSLDVDTVRQILDDLGLGLVDRTAPADGHLPQRDWAA
jgi:hypothetical protein